MDFACINRLLAQTNLERTSSLSPNRELSWLRTANYRNSRQREALRVGRSRSSTLSKKMVVN